MTATAGRSWWSSVWMIWLACFVVIETAGALLTPHAVGTLSVHVWGEWFPEPWARAVLLLFWTVVGIHFANRGRRWYADGRAVAITGALAGLVVLWHERRSIVGWLGDVKAMWTLRAARNRLREAGKMGKLKTVGFALLGAVATGAVAQVTGACPELLSAAPAIVMAGVGGAVTYLMRRPLANAGTKALATGLGAVVLGGIVQQVEQVCGAGFVDKIPSLAMAGAWVGLGLWLKAPHESPGLGSVTPPVFKPPIQG